MRPLSNIRLELGEWMEFHIYLHRKSLLKTMGEWCSVDGFYVTTSKYQSFPICTPELKRVRPPVPMHSLSFDFWQPELWPKRNGGLTWQKIFAQESVCDLPFWRCFGGLEENESFRNGNCELFLQALWLNQPALFADSHTDTWYPHLKFN